MPKFRIEDPSSGRSITIVADKAPTDAEAQQFMADSQPALSAAREQGVVEKAVTGLRSSLSPIIGPSRADVMRDSVVVGGEPQYKPQGSLVDQKGFLPGVVEATGKPVASLPRMGPQDGVIAGAAAGGVNALAGLAESVALSPLSWMTLGLGGELYATAKAGGMAADAATAAGKLMAGTFAVDMGVSAVNNAGPTWDVIKSDAPFSQKVEAALAEAATAVMAGGTARLIKGKTAVESVAEAKRQYESPIEAIREEWDPTPLPAKDYVASTRRPLPDTRGQGTQYHGAAGDISLTESGHFNGKQNILGDGFYTTDAVDIAGTYTKKNAGTEPTVFRVTEKEPVKFYDVGQTMDAGLVSRLEKIADTDSLVATGLQEAKASGDMSLRRVMKEIRAWSKEERVPDYEVLDIFDAIKDGLQKDGYGGFQDVGGLGAGRGKVAPHTVKVYWDPHKQLELTKEAPLLSTEARIAFDEGNNITPPPPALPETAAATPPGKLRGLSERGLASDKLPAQMKGAIKDDPASYYEPQQVPAVAREKAARTETELMAEVASGEGNSHMAAAAELFNRKLAANDQAGAKTVFEEAAKRGTTMGQLINQMKLFNLATPEGTEFAINLALGKKGYDPLPAPTAVIIKDLAGKAIKDAKDLKLADEAYQKRPSPETWAAVEEAMKREEASGFALNDKVSRASPKEIIDDLWIPMMQGSIMTPISIPFNVLANVTGYPARAAGRAVSMFTDAMDAQLTKRDRTIGASPIAGTAAKYRAIVSSAPEVLQALARGNAKQIDKTNIGSQFNSVVAAKNLFGHFTKLVESSMPTKDGKVPLADVGKAFVEATFGMPADMILRGVSAGDIPFRMGERARIITEFGKMRGLPGMEIDRAIKRPDLFFDKKTQDRIAFEADRAVYSQDNAATQAAMGLLKSVKKFSPLAYLGARTIVPFAKTPINVLGEILTFTPVGLMEAASAAKAGNKREYHLAIGKAVVGTTAIGVGLHLYEKGVIAPSYNAMNKRERDGSFSTVAPGTMNASALKRWAAGDAKWNQPRKGDSWVDVTKFGLPGALLQMGADAVKHAEGKAAQQINTVEALAAVGGQAFSYTFNQSFMRNANLAMRALAENKMEDWIAGSMEAMSAPLAPNTLESVARSMRDWKPQFREDDAFKTFANKFQSKLNAVGLSLPGMEKTNNLPLKRDVWGRAIPETPVGRNKYVSIFFDVSRSRGQIEDPVDADLYRLWRRTNDDRVLPQPPGDKMQIGDKQLAFSPAQHERLQAEVGLARRVMTEAIVSTPEWDLMQDETKLNMLTRVYEAGAEKVGKRLFLLDTLTRPEPIKEVQKKANFYRP